MTENSKTKGYGLRNNDSALISYICTMKRTILITFTVLLLAAGCKPKRIPGKTYFDTPSAYNDYIVNEQKAVMESFDDFAGAVNHGDRDSMSFFRKTLNDRAELAESKMESLADYKDDTLFRYSAQELFKYVSLACDNELQEIYNIASKDSAISETDVERIHQLSEIYTREEKLRNDALIAAQEKFAKKFNVIIK